MSTISKKSIRFFNAERSFTVSLEHLPDDDVARKTALDHLYTRLKHKPEYLFDGGLIKVRKVVHPAQEDGAWGGIGVRMLISENYDAADLSRVIGKDLVVYDHISEELFQNGREKRRPATIHKLTAAPHVEPEPAV